MGKRSEAEQWKEKYPFLCTHCDLSFVSQADLDQHLQRVHAALSADDVLFLRSIHIQPWSET